MIDVCLVSMPYGAVERPSIALGLLKSALETSNITTQVIYGNLWFAEEIGLAKYQSLSVSRPELLMGEWTFSGVAFPDFQPNHDEYLETIAYNHPVMRQALNWVRNKADAFIDRVAEAIASLNPPIVSCSSSFQQHCPSLALLRRIKELNPEIVTLMGGANCEGEMGLTTHSAFPWVDFICSGEGDELLVKLCRQILDYGVELTPAQVPYGAIAPCHRHNPQVKQVPRASVSSLDTVKIPNYEEYFTTLSQSYLKKYIKPGIPIETSRGCWWGQKQHCTFCGLNGDGMTYRSKSPERVVKEFTTLHEKYGVDRFFVVDNILDLKHINTVLPILASLEKPYSIFYETKANLKKEQLEQLTKAGVRFIQPGIESLHDQVLQLLRKGNIALMNVQLLKWARQFGILVDWNFLIGIPGESGSWYEEMVEWLPLIFHLQPPSAAYPIRFDRFSLYHENPEEYNLKLSPHRSYSYIYPLTKAQINHIAYYFEDETEEVKQSNTPDWRKTGTIPEHLTFQQCINQWGELFWTMQCPRLTMIREGEKLILTDTRPCAVLSQIVLEGLAMRVYQECDRVLAFSELANLLNDVSEEDLQKTIEELTNLKILLSINNRYLSLAINYPFKPLPSSDDYPGGDVAVHRYVQDQKQGVRFQVAGVRLDKN